MDPSPAAAVPFATTLQSIAIEKIKPSPYQARKTFEEESLLGLVDSISVNSLQQPILVRLLKLPLPSVGDRAHLNSYSAHSRGSLREGGEEGIMYELLAGERRLRAVKRLGWTMINALVQEGVGDQQAAVAGLIENIQRADLNPIETARGYKTLNDSPYSMSQEDIAQKVGKSRATIAQFLGLLKLPVEV